MDGLLLVDKPAGPTSHDVVARMRRALREKRIGHTGTLDPLATGLLPLVLGKATRLAQFLSASDKSYDATIRLGYATDTADAQGITIGEVYAGAWPTREAIDAALEPFRGTFLQRPPAFSAKKIDGRRSYAMARAARGESAPPPRPPEPASVIAHAIRIVSAENEMVTLAVDCSAGFYIRSLAHDLGERLGTGAHLTALRRTRSGDFDVIRAVTLEAAERDPASITGSVVAMSKMLPRCPSVTLTDEGIRHVTHGRTVGPADWSSADSRLVTADSRLGTDDSRLGTDDSRVETTDARLLPRDSRLGDSRLGSPQLPVPSPESRALVRLLDPGGDLIALARTTDDPELLHPFVVLV
jgi:tRNA pseudouridine55 synthase